MTHEKTLEAYEIAGVDYQQTPHDINEIQFNNWIKQSGRQPSIIVNRITRIRTQPNKKGVSEFITWSEKRVGYDHVGNEKSFTEDRMGQYIVPIFRNEFDQSTNTIKALQIERQETVYEHPYDPKLIDDLYKKADPVSIKFYVQLGTNRYVIADYNDFRDGKFEDLLQLGKSERIYLSELRNSEDRERERKHESKITSTKA